MRTPLRRLYFPAVICGVFSFSWASARLASHSDAAISFTLVGPAGMKIVGTGNELQVSDDGQAVTVSIPLTSLTTGFAFSDEPMHEKYLETPIFPHTELRVPRTMLKMPGPGATVEENTTGVLVLHGQSKSVPLHYTSTRLGSKLRVEASMRLDMKDFGIESPAYFGIALEPRVEVAARFEVLDE